MTGLSVESSRQMYLKVVQLLVYLENYKSIRISRQSSANFKGCRAYRLLEVFPGHYLF